MAAPTARYQFYDFISADFQMSDGAGTPAIVTTSAFYPNKITPNVNEIDIAFEGGGQRRHVYLMNDFSVTFGQDCLDLNLIGALYAKTKSTTLTGTPFATEYTPMGDAADAAGAAAGAVFKCPAIENIAGVESIVTLILWVPTGIITNSKPIGMATSAKGDMPEFKFSAVRTTKNIIGTAISGAPTGGAFVYIGK